MFAAVVFVVMLCYEVTLTLLDREFLMSNAFVTGRLNSTECTPATVELSRVPRNILQPERLTEEDSAFNLLMEFGTKDDLGPETREINGNQGTVLKGFYGLNDHRDKKKEIVLKTPHLGKTIDKNIGKQKIKENPNKKGNVPKDKIVTNKKKDDKKRPNENQDEPPPEEEPPPPEEETPTEAPPSVPKPEDKPPVEPPVNPNPPVDPSPPINPNPPVDPSPPVNPNPPVDPPINPNPPETPKDPKPAQPPPDITTAKPVDIPVNNNSKPVDTNPKPPETPITSKPNIDPKPPDIPTTNSSKPPENNDTKPIKPPEQPAVTNSSRSNETTSTAKPTEPKKPVEPKPADPTKGPSTNSTKNDPTAKPKQPHTSKPDVKPKPGPGKPNKPGGKKPAPKKPSKPPNSTNTTKPGETPSDGDPPVDDGNEPEDGMGSVNMTIPLVGFQWERLGVYCTFTGFLGIVAFAKSIFNRIHFFATRIPEPCLMILIGALVGGIVYACDISLAVPKKDPEDDPPTEAPTEAASEYKHHASHAALEEEAANTTTFTMPAFTPELFFFVLVPPTVLESAYTLYDHQFLANIGPIFLFAIPGKLISALGIGFTLLYASKHNLISPILSNETLKEEDAFLFASIVTGIDASSVLPIFEETGVNKDLYFTLLGESLLNDAVTTAMFASVLILRGDGSEHEVQNSQYTMAVLAFLVASVGGFSFGVLLGLTTALLTRFTEHCREVEPMIILGCAYFSYVGAELFIFSGSVSLIGCGLVQSHYAFKNISDTSLTTTINFTKMISTMFDSIVFLYLGMYCVFSIKAWHNGLMFWTLGLSIGLRCIGVLVLSGIYNALGGRRIRMRDQVVIAYCGLRGAVNFALASMLVDFPMKDVFISITIVLILWTIFVQGCTVRFLVETLQIELYDSTSVLFEEVNEQVFSMLISGVEEIAEIHNSGFFARHIKRMDAKFMRKVFLSETVNADMARAMQDVMQHHQQPISQVRAMHKLRVEGHIDPGRPFLGLPSRAMISRLSKGSQDEEELDKKLSPRSSIDSLNKPSPSKAPPISPRQIPIEIQSRRPSNADQFEDPRNDWSEPPPPYGGSMINGAQETPVHLRTPRPSINITPPQRPNRLHPHWPADINALAALDPLEMGRSLRIAVRDSPYQRMRYLNRRRNFDNMNTMNWRAWPQTMPLSNLDSSQHDLADYMPRVPLNPEMRGAIPEALLDSELRRRLHLDRIRNMRPELPPRQAWSGASPPPPWGWHLLPHPRIPSTPQASPVRNPARRLSRQTDQQQR